MINIGFQGPDHPLHIDKALALDFAKFSVFKIDRGVLFQPVVALVIAFNSNDNQILAAFFHVFVHAPGFSVGSVLVKKDIVAVKHVHDGIAAVKFFLVGSGQINVGFPGCISGKLRNGNIPFDNHSFQTSFMMILS